MTVEAHPAARAAALRSAFDRSFAEPPRTGTEEALALLTLRVGGDAYAVELTDVTGLLADRKIVSWPSVAPEFLGLAGVRGSTVPIWSVAGVLGYGATLRVPRWLILVADGGSRQALGLAFEHFDGHVSVARASLSGSRQEGAAAPFVEQSVRVAGASRGILSLSSIIETIRRRTDGSRQRQTER